MCKPYQVALLYLYISMVMPITRNLHSEEHSYLQTRTIDLLIQRVGGIHFSCLIANDLLIPRLRV